MYHNASKGDNMTLRKKVAMELVDKFDADPKIYHRYGLYNGEKIENYYWTKMIKHPDKTPKQVREDLHIYYNDQGKYGPIYTMNRKGFTVTEYQKLKIVIGGYHGSFDDPDYCLYNDIVLIDEKHNISIYSYPEEIFSPLCKHSATVYGHHLYIIGGMHKLQENEKHTMFNMKVYRLNLHNFKIEEIETNNEKIFTLYDHKAKLKKNRIVVQHGYNLDNVKNHNKYVYYINKNKWIIKKEK